MEFIFSIPNKEYDFGIREAFVDGDIEMISSNANFKSDDVKFIKDIDITLFRLEDLDTGRKRYFTKNTGKLEATIINHNEDEILKRFVYNESIMLNVYLYKINEGVRISLSCKSLEDNKIIDLSEITDLHLNIDFEIEKKDFVFIVGRSGCGKSTLLEMVEKEYKNVKRVVSRTTRPIRKKKDGTMEIHGVDYIYRDLIQGYQELSHAIESTKKFTNNYYTLKDDIIDKNIAIVDEVGVENFSKNEYFNSQYNIHVILLKPRWWVTLYRIIKRDGIVDGWHRYSQDIKERPDMDVISNDDRCIVCRNTDEGYKAIVDALKLEKL